QLQRDAALPGDLAGQLHGGAVVHFGEDDEEIDAAPELMLSGAAAALHVSRMKRDLMSGALGDVAKRRFVPLHATDDADAHSCLPFSFRIQYNGCIVKAAVLTEEDQVCSRRTAMLSPDASPRPTRGHASTGGKTTSAARRGRPNWRRRWPGMTWRRRSRGR